jgi:hypothetical protein
MKEVLDGWLEMGAPGLSMDNSCDYTPSCHLSDTTP